MDSEASLTRKFDQLMMSIVTPFRQDVEEALDGLQSNSSIMNTRHGPVEYSIVHDDLADNGTVLISHTAVGGYDQGVAVARRFPHHRVIAISRAGYLRTPSETAPTPAHMADTCADLIANLDIDTIVMVGLSAGGMSAIQFAIQYPQHCAGLVLGSAITQPLPALVQNVMAPLALANQSDFLNWLFSQVTARVTIPLRVQDEDSRTILATLLQTNPTSHRWQGYKKDIEQIRSFQPDLSTITVPTLMIHGTADVVVPLSQAKEAAATIPEAELLIIDGGQHDCPVLYPEQISPVLSSFLDRCFGRS